MEKLFRTPALPILLEENFAASATKAPTKIQIMRTGTFSHPRYGKFEITKQTLASIVKNFQNRVRRVDIAVDYKHDNEDKAAAWLSKVFLDESGNGLWAEPKWTPTGERVVADKEFRFTSPEFTQNYVDLETKEEHGPTLLGVGLTNRPHIKDMAPVVELTEGESTMDPKDIQIKALTDKEAELTKKLNDMSQLVAGAQMSPEQMLAKIKELEAELAQYKGQAQAAETKLAEQTKEASFNKMLSEGKACAAQKEAFLKNDMVKFAELAQTVKLDPKGTTTTTEPTKTDSTTPAQDKVLELAEKKRTANKDLSVEQSIDMVLSEDKTLRSEYEKEVEV